MNICKLVKFLAEVSTKLHKMHFLDNLRTITQEGNMETRQMTLFFSSNFSALTFCNIHFFLENIHFNVVFSFVHFGL